MAVIVVEKNFVSRILIPVPARKRSSIVDSLLHQLAKFAFHTEGWLATFVCHISRRNENSKGFQERDFQTSAQEITYFV